MKKVAGEGILGGNEGRNAGVSGVLLRQLRLWHHGGSVLPPSVRVALGVMLYGMFIAVVVPQARKEQPILLNMLLALVFSCLFAWVPGLADVSAGLAVVICTVAAAAICALVFPVEQEVAE